MESTMDSRIESTTSFLSHQEDVFLPLPSSSNSPTVLSSIVSDELVNIISIINFAVICGILVLLGSLANAINIIVFYRIGFKDPVNISLLMLGIADFGCCFTLILFVFNYNPFFRELDLPFDPNDFHYQSGWVHIIFSRINSIITAFITFERCLCVASPLKVKEIITPKRAVIFLACTFIVVFVSYWPHFYTSRYVWKYIPGRNRSIIVMEFIENRKDFDDNAAIFHSIIMPFTSFIVVVVSTILLVVNLKKKSKFRKNATTVNSSSTATTGLSSRDVKVARMVVTIAVLFIVCFMPNIFSFAAWMAVPEFYYKGQYGNLLVVTFSFHFVLEAINSSLNIFIYHRMSSNYRAVFQQLFGRKQSEKNN